VKRGPLCLPRPVPWAPDSPRARRDSSSGTSPSSQPHRGEGSETDRALSPHLWLPAASVLHKPLTHPRSPPPIPFTISLSDCERKAPVPAELAIPHSVAPAFADCGGRHHEACKGAWQRRGALGLFLASPGSTPSKKAKTTRKATPLEKCGGQGSHFAALQWPLDFLTWQQQGEKGRRAAGQGRGVLRLLLNNPCCCSLALPLSLTHRRRTISVCV
jgi:hypothetical protein